MKRKLRQKYQLLSLVVTILTAIWLLFPHDICLTRILADQCVCLSEVQETSDCGCCASGRKSVHIACGDSHGTKSDPDHETNACYSFSSDYDQVTNPVRVMPAPPVLTVMALKPLPTANLSKFSNRFFPNNPVHAYHESDKIHRDNCVFII